MARFGYSMARLLQQPTLRHSYASREGAGHEQPGGHGTKGLGFWGEALRQDPC